ncbi:MAG: putative PEP-binding protein, partial [Ornithinimicrobium sp.]
SIGTNDLTQYTMAAERGNAGVERLFDPLDPSVLTLIAQVCRDVAEGVSVGVCGGAASDPTAAALLVGLGVDDLSATPVAVPRVKAALRRHTLEQLQELAQRALRCDSAVEVREILAGLD